MSYTVEQLMDDHNIDPQRVEAIRQEMIEEMRQYELKEARKSQSVTQKQLAERMGVSQKRISTLESGEMDRTEIRTLKKYLQAIGGRLQINAIMPDGRTLQLV